MSNNLDRQSFYKKERWFIVILIVYAVFRLYALYTLPLQAYIFDNDALRYLNDAHCAFLSACLYTDRPFFYPLLIKVLDYRYLALSSVQCLASIAAWGFFAFCLKQQIQTRRLAYTAFAFTLLYSCAGYLTLWDSKALTESLSLSFLLCYIGCYILALQNRFSQSSLTGLVLFGFLLVNVRDGNLYFVLFSAIATMIASLLSGLIPKKAACILLAASLLTFLFNLWTVDLGQRWLMPMADLLANRIIIEPSMLQYFLNHGMPDIIKQVRAAQGTFEGYNILKSEPVAFNWFIENGRSVYAHYLISHPSYLLAIYRNASFWQDLISAPTLLQYISYGLNIGPASLNSVLFSSFANILSDLLNSLALLLISILLLLGLIAYFEGPRSLQKDKIVLFAELLIFFSVFILPLFIWLSEPMENMRHQLNNHLQIVIGILLFSFKTLDYTCLNLKRKPGR